MPEPLFDRGGVALYHGDSAVLLPALGVKADLIVTSPPYDDMRDYGGDGFDFAAVAPAIADSLADGGVMAWHCNDKVVDGGYSGRSLRQALAFQELGLRMHDRLIIGSSRQGAWALTRYIQNWDYCWIFSKGKPKTFNPICDKPNSTAGATRMPIKKTGRDANGAKPEITYVKIKPRPKTSKRLAYWYIPAGKGHYARPLGDCHPALMQLPLATDLIRSYSNPGDLVLDPFSGSGTTAYAAQRLGRRAIGIEIHKPYIEAAIERRFVHQPLFAPEAQRQR